MGCLNCSRKSLFFRGCPAPISHHTSEESLTQRARLGPQSLTWQHIWSRLGGRGSREEPGSAGADGAWPNSPQDHRPHCYYFLIKMASFPLITKAVFVYFSKIRQARPGKEKKNELIKSNSMGFGKELVAFVTGGKKSMKWFQVERETFKNIQGRDLEIFLSNINYHD